MEAPLPGTRDPGPGTRDPGPGIRGSGFGVRQLNKSQQDVRGLLALRA
jgi:hypothetical protein